MKTPVAFMGVLAATVLLCGCQCPRQASPFVPPSPLAQTAKRDEGVRVEGKALWHRDKSVAVLITLRNTSTKPLLVSLVGPHDTWVASYSVAGATTGGGAAWTGFSGDGCPDPRTTLVVAPGSSAGRGQAFTIETDEHVMAISLHVKIVKYNGWQCGPVEFIETTLDLPIGP